MIENDFLMVRAALANVDATVLRVGVINYLKELEREWHEWIDTDYAPDMDPGPPEHDAWEIADSIFQYAFFTTRKDYTEDIEDEPHNEVMDPEDIETEIRNFRKQIDETTNKEDTDE